MGKCAGNIVVVSTLILSLIWLIIICLPVGWHSKSTLIWNFHVGLYYVKVDRAIVGSLVHGIASGIDMGIGAVRGKQTKALSGVTEFITVGEESLRFYRDMFCNTAMLPIASMNCAPWEHLLWGSWLLLLSTIISIILLCLGACFMWYYTHHSSRTKVRKWAWGFLAAGPTFNLLGLAGCTYDFLFVLALTVHLFTWAPIMIACTCAKMGEQEDMAEELAWEKKKLLYGFDDEYGFEDPYDEYGNPRQQYDEYGNPLPMYDEYGNPVHGPPSHVSAYSEHEMAGYGAPSFHTDPYGQPPPGAAGSDLYGSYHDPYAQDPYASQPPAQPTSGYQPTGYAY